MDRLQNIETFAEVADQLSFAAAARRLGLPASTVTSRIRTLEQSLGVRLLDRTTRRVALTPAGALFLDRCRRALDEIDAARDLVAAEAKASGLLRLSVPTALPMAPLAALTSAFLRDYPQISINITVDDTPADFIADGIDLALRGNRPGSDSLIARVLSQTPVVLAAAPGQLANEDLPILGPLARHLTDRRADSRITCESFALALELVRSGAARGCFPRPMCDADYAAGQLDLAPPPTGVETQLTLYLVYPDRRPLPQRLRLFIDRLVAAYTSS
ncbi:LysR family transcriptional regulator [Phaeobacter sp. HS012]|uniref:LysR family transcriptional regulator n=1 Tax=unclassified Phaeobacter TaxID=2621772 RepID=UPI001B38B98B|nr:MULTISPECIES: LysR family transcriptional regulator [unclassified Phaeobacter]MBQ4805982.1 LysR family transcriptional regulator [Phaeobacter sp. HS012]MBQ4880832.1 LysR family transcriptional regulator [Phaeobacter sp. HS011]